MIQVKLPLHTSQVTITLSVPNQWRGYSGRVSVQFQEDESLQQRFSTMLCGSGSGPLTSEKCLYPTSEFEFSVSSATQGAGDNQLVCMSFPLLTMVSFNQRSNWTHYSSWYQVWTIDFRPLLCLQQPSCGTRPSVVCRLLLRLFATIHNSFISSWKRSIQGVIPVVECTVDW